MVNRSEKQAAVALRFIISPRMRKTGRKIRKPSTRTMSRALSSLGNGKGVGRTASGLTSSIVTCGPTEPGVLGDEERRCPMPQCYTDYQASKMIGEQKSCEYAGQGLPLIVVNPTRVYGPGKMSEGNSVTRMIDLYDRGTCLFSSIEGSMLETMPS